MTKKILKDMPAIYEYVEARIVVHPIQAALIRKVKERAIVFERHSLREIGKMIGEDSPQKISHHFG